MKRCLQFVPLLLVLFLAILLRFYRISDTPAALNWDEVSHGYNAYSILKTGKDEWGVSWPLIFRAYGDYKLPVYIYLTAISEAVFGLKAFAVRFPSVLAGLGSVLFTYLLVKRLLKNKPIALLSALFLAISPWHFFLSRPAFEANVASFLVIAGIYFFLLGLEKNWLMILAIFSLGFSLHTYNSARLFVPLALAFLLLLYQVKIKSEFKKRRKEFLLTAVIFLIFFIPLVISFLSPSGKARFNWVTIIDSGAINRINQARITSSLPKPLPVLVHNKATYFIAIFGKNFLSNLSPKYLFLTGGSNYQYNIPGRGVLYPVEIFPLVFGLWWLWKNRKKSLAKLIFFWWMLAIIPAAITRDNPHVLRTILVLPTPQIIMAVGIQQFIRLVRKPTVIILGGIYVFILFLLVGNFLNSYFGTYREKYSWSWQYGYSQAADYLQPHWSKYDKIFFTKKYGEPHEFILFYLKWDPSAYQQDPTLNRYFRSDWYWVDSFDKFVFINDWEVKEKTITYHLSPVTYLLVTSPGNYPEGWSRIQRVDFLDGQPAFEILEKQ